MHAWTCKKYWKRDQIKITWRKMPTRIEEKYCVTKNSLGFNYLHEKVCEKSRWYLFSLYNFIQNRSKTIAYFTRKSIRPFYYYGYILQYNVNNWLTMFKNVSMDWKSRLYIQNLEIFIEMMHVRRHLLESMRLEN